MYNNSIQYEDHAAIVYTISIFVNSSEKENDFFITSIDQFLVPPNGDIHILWDTWQEMMKNKVLWNKQQIMYNNTIQYEGHTVIVHTISFFVKSSEFEHGKCMT